MPRRLAPLLISLYIVLINAQKPTQENTHAPVKAVAVVHTDVFIPLKQWKQQRLQDLESRVRKAEQKRTHPRRFLSAVCKPRARLLAFLSRLDVCPPTPEPTTTQIPSSGDPYWVSASHAYGDVNRSIRFDRTPSPNEVQSSTDHAVSSPSVEQPVDSHDTEEAIASVEPTLDTESNEKHQVSSEPDELTGRIEGYIPKVLPNVLPRVIPKVNEIVKSLKEVSLAYAMSGEIPADSLKPSDKSGSSARRGKTNANSTSQERHCKNPASDKSPPSDSDNGKAPTTADTDTTAGLLEDDHILSMIVKHNNDPGVKEKPFNYASIDAGARVLASSDGVVGATNVIQGSNDKYLLSPCAGSGIAGSRFVDLELSEDVILESIDTGNFEYYSSSPRKVAVLGEGIYPPKKWNVLGIFDFANVKTLQKFQIEKRAVTRYLRVIFAGKQGTEYYCPISTVRAFGKNLLADWKEVMEKPTGTRNHLKGNGGLTKNKLDKEGDKSRSGNGKNAKKSDTGSSAKAENTSENVSKSHGSQTSSTPDNDTSEEDEPGDVHSEGVHAQGEDTEHAGNSDAPSTLVGQNSGEGENRNTGRGYDESDSNSDEADKDKRQNEVEENTDDDDDTSDTSHTSFSDDDHVSEDDQVVIDALRSDTLAPVDGDDNIFRKVTRMLQVLELNQTLTNQYIDTQLSKFAVALSGSLSNSRNATERVEVMQKQLEIMVVRLENQIELLTRANFRRDLLMCVLLVCVAFLLGTHWILWSTVSGTRLPEDSRSRSPPCHSVADRVDRILQTDDVSTASLARIEGISSEGPSPAGKKKKRKDRRKPFAGEYMNGGHLSPDRFSSPANGTDAMTERRSVSSVDLPTNNRRRFRSTGGSFDILGRVMDQ